MLSFVLLPILRASITPLRTFHQRSLLLSDVNCASISEKYLPRFERGFLWISLPSFDASSPKKLCFSQAVQPSCFKQGFGEIPCNFLGQSAFFCSLLPIFFCQSGPSADSGGKPMRGKVCGFRRGSGCPLDGRWHYQASLQGRIT